MSCLFLRVEFDPASAMQSRGVMSVVKRKKENIDMLEHAMMGVRTLDDEHRIVSFAETNGIIGSSSRIEVGVRDSNTEDREVIVTMPKVGRRKTA